VPRANDLAATGGLASAVYTMGVVLFVTAWALVAAIPCQDRGLQAHFAVPRSFPWASPVTTLYERVLEESKKRSPMPVTGRSCGCGRRGARPPPCVLKPPSHTPTLRVVERSPYRVDPERMAWGLDQRRRCPILPGEFVHGAERPSRRPTHLASVDLGACRTASSTRRRARSTMPGVDLRRSALDEAFLGRGRR
jgi:hypothetical protein